MVKVPGDQGKLTDCPVWLLVGESGSDGTGSGEEGDSPVEGNYRDPEIRWSNCIVSSWKRQVRE